jgi:hypothetical protein
MSKVDEKALFTAMDDEIEQDRQNLKPLFPNLNDEELKAVEDTFYGYLEIAWRIFERIETKEEQRAQKKRANRSSTALEGQRFFEQFCESKKQKTQGL